MGSQYDIWLYTLLFVSSVGLIRTLRVSITWVWPVVAQASIVALIALSGLIIGPDWLFAPIGWLCFCVFFVVPKFLMKQYEMAITALDPDKLESRAHMLRYFYWGQYGQFWQAMAAGLILAMKGKGELAEAIFSDWKKKNLPDFMQQNIETYQITAETMVWNWQGAIAEFERLVASRTPVPKTLMINVARAYAELGRFGQSARVIEAAQLQATKFSVQSLAAGLLPVFCLFGARDKVERLISYLSNVKNALPPSLKFYWWGRCNYAEGNFDEAKLSFEQALRADKNLSGVLQERIETFLKLLREPISREEKEDPTEPIRTIWNIFEESAYVQSLVTPGRGSRAVGAIVICILACYFISDSNSYFPNDFTGQLKVLTYNFGMLNPGCLEAGEYWRLVTYLFLHAHISHVVLNVLGLYWFGRIAENIFGSRNFFVIYFVAGAFSGVAHSLLAPGTMAIGASGAVMGVFGAVLAGIYRLKDVIPETLRRSELLWMAALVAGQIVLDQIIPHVAGFAHLGGLVAGIVLGLLLRIPSRKPVC
jgi:membrane associated rhomboid family serine protease